MVIRFLLSAWRLICRYNFNPVAVRIGDKVDAHFLVLKTDDSHIFVFLVEGVKLVCLECQMKLAFSKIVWLFPVPEPGQFQIEICDPVSQEYQFEESSEAVFSRTGSKPRASL